MIEIGMSAPDFTLSDHDGKLFSLEEFKGKWIVLYFYPKDNTSGCTKEALDFSMYRKDFNKLNAEVVGISPDPAEIHKKFIDKHKITISLLSDSERKTLKDYGAWGIKKNYGKVYEGVIRSTFLISPKGKVEEVWKNVRVRVKRKNREIKHAEMVLERLRETVSV